MRGNPIPGDCNSKNIPAIMSIINIPLTIGFRKKLINLSNQVIRILMICAFCKLFLAIKSSKSCTISSQKPFFRASCAVKVSTLPESMMPGIYISGSTMASAILGSLPRAIAVLRIIALI
ncbi:MAG: hypothetical protein BWX61_01387 [Bacteroidetes bacterium ADurb.Bin035]|nr:MAG: hypothetical protein BWX61_01387 [Bacteroidetes bacterium ADurb.Bin035]